MNISNSEAKGHLSKMLTGIYRPVLVEVVTKLGPVSYIKTQKGDISGCKHTILRNLDHLL
jgi:hypothetical protein